MKKSYSIEEFFVADMGKIIYVYEKGVPHKKFQKKGTGFVKRHSNYNYNYYYYDIVTDIDYSLKNSLEKLGDCVVKNLIPFSTYIDTLYEETKHIDFFSKRIKKIIDERIISKYDIKLILKYLNKKEKNKENNQINFNFCINPFAQYFNHKLSQKENINYITNLTKKNYEFEPAVGIDNEIKELMIILAQEKNNPILVGPNGVGKTSIVNELAYRIQKNEVPNFLKRKRIIDITKLINDSKYSEKIKNDFELLIQSVIKNEDIIFIDDIDTILNINNCIIDIIKANIKDLKIISTTTKQIYNRYFYASNSFEKIEIKEPTNENLYQIIEKTFNDYSKKNKISIYDDIQLIINTLIELTKKENLTKYDNIYDDSKEQVDNPSIVIEIIDKIFASAKANNQKNLTIDDAIYGIKSCDKIKDNIKQEFIKEIKGKSLIKKINK